MREYRNRVAHNKFISWDEYNLCTVNLRTINIHLSNALDTFNINSYTLEEQYNLNLAISSKLNLFIENNSDIINFIRDSLSAPFKMLEPQYKTVLNNIGQLISSYQHLNLASSSLLTSAYNAIPKPKVANPRSEVSIPRIIRISPKASVPRLKTSKVTIRTSNISPIKTNKSPRNVNLDKYSNGY